MNTLALHKAIDELPATLQELVAKYVADLQRRQATDENISYSATVGVRASRMAGLGELQGNVWMADDFNAPLADFAEY